MRIHRFLVSSSISAHPAGLASARGGCQPAASTSGWVEPGDPSGTECLLSSHQSSLLPKGWPVLLRPSLSASMRLKVPHHPCRNVWPPGLHRGYRSRLNHEPTAPSERQTSPLTVPNRGPFSLSSAAADDYGVRRWFPQVINSS